MIAVIVLAYNRVDMLRKCVENVLLRTSDKTTELLVWDNASTDTTPEYLASVQDPRLRVVRSETNIGLNAFAKALPLTNVEYLITLDEDVIDAPEGWDSVMLDAFQRLPDVGFLAANQVDDPNSECAWIMHHRDKHLYTDHEVNGVRLLEGPVGGWCAMTSRSIHDSVGGYPTHPRHIFFHHDAAYIKSIATVGLRASVLRDLSVFHASGPYYSTVFTVKDEYYAEVDRHAARRDAVKRVLLRIPGVAAMNGRHGWFHPPAVKEKA